MIEPLDRPTKRTLALLVLALWDSVLVGNPAPVVRQRYERMRGFRPGDVVVEMSTLSRLVNFDLGLVDDRWDGQFVKFIRTDRDSLGRDEHLCLNPDGSEFRWSNADLVAVPELASSATHPTRTRAAASVLAERERRQP